MIGPSIKIKTRACLCASIALVAAFAISSTAQASTIQVSFEDLEFDASAGETNQVVVDRVGANYTIADSGPTLTAGFGCVAVDTHHATCPVAGVEDVSIDVRDLGDAVQIGPGVSGDNIRLDISGGDGGDQLTAGLNIDTDIFGGNGNDTLTGLDQRERLGGGDGEDTLSGGSGPDSLEGGIGNDSLSGGDGGDTFSSESLPDGADAVAGGSGRDEMSYSSRDGALSVSLNGVADDGDACPGLGCEGDNVGTDVEDVYASQGNDTITGSSAASRIFGSGGNDTIDAGAGDDEVQGGDGDDTLEGGAGQDEIRGDDGSDRSDGGPGDDLIRGDPFPFDTGSDVLRGGAGTDVADYEGTSTPLKIDLDGHADDGAAGENDNVGTDVEDLVGGDAGDRLTGNRLSNDISGGAGRDRISGGKGADGLHGENGPDVLVGGSGTDFFEGGEGGDLIKARDNHGDELSCGAGTDRGTADRSDRQGPDCDRVKVKRGGRGR